MRDREAAVAVARRFMEAGRDDLDLAAPREIATGWYFTYAPLDDPKSGSNGIIVNKSTGRVFVLGSGFRVERDLRFYDKGYQAKAYDLVVTEVYDHDATVKQLLELELGIVVPEYRNGVVWRIGRSLTKAEISDRLADLPCVFEEDNLYFQFEQLEQAESSEAFELKVIPRGSPPREYEGIRS